MPALIWPIAAVLALFVGQWIASKPLRDASIVDRFWGPAFVLGAWTAFAVSDGWAPRGLLVAGLVTAWGLRLGWHIHRRNRGHGEDYRYQAMRARHGERFWLRSLVTVFLLQGVLNLLIAAPVYAAVLAATPSHWTLWDGLGGAVWAGGLYFEATADAQLKAFKADPANKGKVMDRGLWAWSRHPNYFGDALLWAGYGVIALGVPGGIYTLYGPAVMAFFLMKVSGVPLLEKRMMARPGYPEYAARTPAFFPRPPRR